MNTPVKVTGTMRRFTEKGMDAAGRGGDYFAGYKLNLTLTPAADAADDGEDMDNDTTNRIMHLVSIANPLHKALAEDLGNMMIAALAKRRG